MRRLKYKGVAVCLCAALIVTGVAFAYFTSQGTGSGTATVGTDSGVAITPVTITGTLYPGGSATVGFTVKNNSASAALKVGKVVADTSGGNTNGISGLPAGCSAGDLHFADVTLNQVVPKGGQVTGSGTLAMDDSASNQDACKGGSPVLHLKVDNTGL